MSISQRHSRKHCYWSQFPVPLTNNLSVFISSLPLCSHFYGGKNPFNQLSICYPDSMCLSPENPICILLISPGFLKSVSIGHFYCTRCSDIKKKTLCIYIISHTFYHNLCGMAFLPWIHFISISLLFLIATEIAQLSIKVSLDPIFPVSASSTSLPLLAHFLKE